MRAMRCLMAAVLVAGLVVVAGAQPGGGFGFGGRPGPAQLVANKAVQEDLKLTDEQVEKVKTWGKEYQDKVMADMKGKLADLKDATKEERAEKLAAWSTENNKTAYKALGEVLKPEQIKRLKQIEVQANGVTSFQNADVVAALKLTDSQKSTIKGVVTDYNKDVQEIRTAAGIGGKGAKVDPDKRAEADKKIDKLRKEAMAKVEDALNDDQKKTWKELTGAAFDISKLNTPRGKN